MDKKDFIYFVAELILQKKGTDIKILNLEGKTSVTDYFVICSASSTTMVKAIADHVLKETKIAGERVWRDEGYSGLTWVLLDFVDVVVHIFNEETRKFYNLEGLWGDAEVIEINEDFKFKKKTRKKSK
jgi:ribosome-associated protein